MWLGGSPWADTKETHASGRRHSPSLDSLNRVSAEFGRFIVVNAPVTSLWSTSVKSLTLGAREFARPDPNQNQQRMPEITAIAMPRPVPGDAPGFFFPSDVRFASASCVMTDRHSFSVMPAMRHSTETVRSSAFVLQRNKLHPTKVAAHIADNLSRRAQSGGQVLSIACVAAESGQDQMERDASASVSRSDTRCWAPRLALSGL